MQNSTFPYTRDNYTRRDLFTANTDDLRALVLDADRFTDFCTFDIESEIVDGQWSFVLGHVYFAGVSHCYYTIDDLHFALKSLNVPAYAHNLDFDVLFFMRQPHIMEKVKDQPIISSGNLMLTVTIDGVEFRNSLALFPMSLLKIVQKFLKITDKEYENDKLNVLTIRGDNLSFYCGKDCYFLFLAIVKYRMFTIKHGADVSLTTPATALKIFKKVYLPENKNLLAPRNRNKFFDTGYYFGGHTEKFTAGKYVFRNVYYYDVNSLYPAQMHKMEFGTTKLERRLASMQNLKALFNKGNLMFCELLVNIDSEELRFFPHLDDEKKMNKYTSGVQTIKTSELGIKFILKWGGWGNIISAKQILVYSDTRRVKPFKRYVDHFYGLRKSDTSNDAVCKLLLNALYGKFGEKLKKETRYINLSEHESGLEPVSFGRIDKDGAMVSKFIEDAPFYKEAMNRLDIAGKITEGARLDMGDYINTIRSQGGNVVYTDTDSLITDYCLEGSPLEYMVHNEQLGKLSNEIGHKDNVIILGVKTYHFYKCGKKATKGVKNMELQDFREIIRGKTKFTNTRFSRMNALITRGFFGIQQVPYEIRNILERLD